MTGNSKGNNFTLAEGYKYAANPDAATNEKYPWAVIPKINPVAQIGDTQYGTLVEAVEAVQDGETITLVEDLDFSEDAYAGYKWAGSTYNPLTITNNNVTLDLNNHTISNMGNNALVFGHILARDGGITGGTIKNGTLIAGTTDNVTNSYVLGIAGVDGMTVTNLTTVGGINVYTESKNVVIDGCDVRGTKYYAVCAQTGSEVTIRGTTYAKNTDATVATKAMFWVQGAGKDTDTATDENPQGNFEASSITIEGGAFTVNPDGDFCLTGSGKVPPAVKGGIYSVDPSAYTAPDYFAVDNTDPETSEAYPYAISYAAAKVNGTAYRTFPEAIQAVNAASGDITVELFADGTIDLSKNGNVLGGPGATKITINGNDHTVTFNLTQAWSQVNTANNAPIELNDVNVTTSTGFTPSGTVLAVYNHNISFNCVATLNNVTSDKALAFWKDVTLDTVTVAEPEDAYAVWIHTTAATASIKNLTVNTTAGRGIKVDDTFVNTDHRTPTATAITIDGATFATKDKKSAVLVNSSYATTITATGTIDISDVPADTTHLVWVDENSATRYGLVTVNGAAKDVEPGDYAAKLSSDSGIKGYYTTLAGAIGAAAAEDTVTLLKNVAEAVVIDSANKITLDGQSLYGIVPTSSTHTALKITASNAEVELKNITIGDKTYTGRAVNIYNAANVKLTVTNSRLYATTYALNVYNEGAGSVDNVDITVDGTEIEGWAALNLWGNGGKVTVAGGKLTGNNTSSYKPGDNEFGVIVLEGLSSRLDGATNYDISVTGTELKATSLADAQGNRNEQGFVLFNPKADGNKVTLTDCTVERGQGEAAKYPLIFEETGCGDNALFVKNVTDKGTSNVTALPVSYAHQAASEGYSKVVPSVAAIYGTGYATLQAAVAAVPSTGEATTIRLLVDLADNTIAINGGRNVVLDLDGKKLTPSFLYVLNGALEVKNGTIDGTVYVYGLNEDETGMASVFTLAESATVDSHYGVILYEYPNTHAAYDATVSIAGTVKGNVWVMGNIEEGDSSISVSGAVDATGKSDVGIALNGAVALSVADGASVESDGTGIEVRAGTLSVTGGTIVGNGVPASSQGNNNGTTSTGAGIAVSTYDLSDVAVSVTGGEIKGYAPLYIVNTTGTQANGLDLSISGGTFTTINGGANAIAADASETRAVSFVSGGLFSSQVVEGYCATGYVPLRLPNAEGYYTVKQGDYVAQVGDEKYATLVEAVAFTQEGTIKVLADSEGAGIFVGQSDNKDIVIDFDGHTYTCTGPAVGSTGTATQAFHLEKNNTVVLKGGTVTSTADSGVKMLVQNYSDLTVKGMVLDGTHMQGSGRYVLSNNNGNVVVDGTTINAKEGDFAFDVCRYATYTSVDVEVTGNSTINGNVEVSASGSDAKDGFGLKLTSGTLNGEIVLDDSAKAAMAATTEKVSITKAVAFEVAAPADYKWVDGTTLVAKVYVAQIGTTKYETLAEAMAAAQNGDTVTMLGDVALDATVVAAGKSIVLDLNGRTLTGQNNADISVYGSLTLVDSTDTAANGTGTGKIVAGYDYGTGHKSSLVKVRENGEFTMQSGLIYAVRENATNKGQYGVGWDGNAKINIAGGRIEAGWYAISGNGNNTGKPTVNVTGGSLVSTSDYAIYMSDAVSVTITGDDTVVDGTAGAVCIRRGSLTIKGGNFATSGTGDTGTWSDGTGNLTPNVLINVPANLAANNNEQCPVKISGGTFVAANDIACLSLGNTTAGSIAVAGGYFSSQVPEDYCAASCKPTGPLSDHDNMYSVTLAGDHEVEKVVEDGTGLTEEAAEVLKQELATDEKAVEKIKMPAEVAVELKEEQVEQYKEAFEYKVVESTTEEGKYDVVLTLKDTVKAVSTDSTMEGDKTEITIDTIPGLFYSIETSDNTAFAGSTSQELAPEMATAATTKLDISGIEPETDETVKYFKVVTTATSDGTAISKKESKTFGVMKTETPATKLTIIAVPWQDVAATTDTQRTVKVSSMIKTEELAEGTKIHVAKGEGGYNTWKLQGGKWVDLDAVVTETPGQEVEPAEGVDASNIEVPQGGAFWVEQEDPKPIVMIGQVGDQPTTKTVKRGSNLCASPKGVKFDLNKITNAAANDTIVVPVNSGEAAKIYQRKNGKWKYWKFTNGRGAWVEDESEIPAGTGFWYNRTGGDATINWE